MTTSKRQLYKVIIIGDSAVGKTSLLNQYVNDRFTQHYRATVGADFMAKEVMVDDRLVSLQICDTAGQDRFQSLGRAFYRGADCCVLVYDITNAKSFESLETWRDEFLLQGAPKEPEKFPFILLGNKCDREADRKVPTLKAETWCKNHGGIKLFEVSAKENKMVEEAFQEIAKAATSNTKEEIYFPVTVQLKKPSEERKQDGTCPC